MVYQRAKGTKSDEPFGTLRDVTAVGYEFLRHSMRARLAEKMTNDNQPRVRLGGPGLISSPTTSPAQRFSDEFRCAVGQCHRIPQRRCGQKVDSPTTPAKAGSAHITFGGDLIWEIGSGYFGCRDSHGQSDPETFEKGRVPVGQNSFIKSGETWLGGASGPKVSAKSGDTRSATGQTVVSPPAHTAFHTPLELVEFIRHTAQTFRR